MPIYKQISRGHAKPPGIEMPTVGQVGHFFRTYRQPLLVGGILVIVFAAVWGGATLYRGHRNAQATEAWAHLPTEAPARSEALWEVARRYPKTGGGIRARFYLGQQAFAESRYEDAIAAYRPLTELPDRQAMIRTLARHNLAAVYEAMGQWPEALAEYRKAAVDPANVMKAYSYYDLARAYQATGQDEEARPWYEKAADEGIALPVGDRAKERLQWLDSKKSPNGSGK